MVTPLYFMALLEIYTGRWVIKGRVWSTGAASVNLKINAKCILHVSIYFYNWEFLFNGTLHAQGLPHATTDLRHGMFEILEEQISCTLTTDTIDEYNHTKI